eukprot:scaffold1320_cov326-Prasinococcus_capsulatus_cf.AAC.3
MRRRRRRARSFCAGRAGSTSTATATSGRPWRPRRPPSAPSTRPLCSSTDGARLALERMHVPSCAVTHSRSRSTRSRKGAASDAARARVPAVCANAPRARLGLGLA